VFYVPFFRVLFTKYMTPKTQKIIPAGMKENVHEILVPNELPDMPE